MEKIIYHGSDHVIEQPKFGYGKIYNDYEIGFYCTENSDMAKEWGVSLHQDGYANRYKINCDGLTVLDLNTDKYTMLHWLTILLENREFDVSSPLALEAKEYLMRNFHPYYETAETQEWYKKKTFRDQSARKQYFDVERNRRQRGDLYITAILDEEMKPDDPRLR